MTTNKRYPILALVIVALFNFAPVARKFIVVVVVVVVEVLIIHYENMPMQYTEVFKVVKNENFQ